MTTQLWFSLTWATTATSQVLAPSGTALAKIVKPCSAASLIRFSTSRGPWKTNSITCNTRYCILYCPRSFCPYSPHTICPSEEKEKDMKGREGKERKKKRKGEKDLRGRGKGADMKIMKRIKESSSLEQTSWHPNVPRRLWRKTCDIFLISHSPQTYIYIYVRETFLYYLTAEDSFWISFKLEL